MRTANERKELRAHPRISAPLRACLLNDRGERSEIPVRDISLGGLFLFTPNLVAQVGEVRTLELGTQDGGFFLTVQAEVVRAVMAPDTDELLGIGMQFTGLGPDQKARLGELMARLIEGKGGDRRAFPRLSYRVTVLCDGAVTATALLKDLSLGGAGLWLDTPVAIGQEVTLQVEGTKTALRLPGRVVSTRWPRHDEPFAQAGIQFTTLDDATVAALRVFLRNLLGV